MPSLLSHNAPITPSPHTLKSLPVPDPTHAPQVLKELRDETAAMMGSHMQITPDQGALLGLLVELMGVRRAIEVGVFTGYSSVAVALVGGGAR